MNAEPVHSGDMLKAALEFLAAGVCAIPAMTDGTKRPVGTWKEYQTRASTLAELVGWFSDPQAVGLGVVTGTVSGNLEMCELEGRAVADGIADQAREIAYNSGLAEVWDKLASGYIETTPSGGLHWLYRVEGDVPGNAKLARRPGVNGGVEVLAETRGQGGFVIVAPSHGTTHDSGKPWVRIAGSPSAIVTLTLDERNAFHALLRSFDSMPAVETVAASVMPKVEGEISPADDFNARASWDELLEGWSRVYTDSQGVTYWRRPGKRVGISATTGRNSGDNLFVFTTSTMFEAEKPMSKFAVLAKTRFAGDMSAAGRWLRANGYGTQAERAPLQPLQPLQQLQPLRLVEAPPEAPQSDEEASESTWQPVNLWPHLSGEHIAVMPSLLRRSDQIPLLYAGKVHSFYGESESGKSWLAQWASVECLRAGQHVLYVDFEADAADVVERLKLLGASNAEINTYFTYIRPEQAPNEADPAWQAVLDTPRSLAIIDGVTEALTIWGGETKDNDLITIWNRRFPRRLARESGAAVVTIDHVAKNQETRGRFAIGGQAKLAALDGAAFLIEPVEVLAPGVKGKLAVRVTKDRPGQVRKHGGDYRKSDRTQVVAEAVFDATGEGLSVALYPPSSREVVAADRDEFLVAAIREALLFAGTAGLNSKQLRELTKADGTGYRASDIDRAVELGITAGVIHRVEGGAGRPNVHLLPEFINSDNTG